MDSKILSNHDFYWFLWCFCLTIRGKNHKSSSVISSNLHQPTPGGNKLLTVVHGSQPGTSSSGQSRPRDCVWRCNISKGLKDVKRSPGYFNYLQLTHCEVKNKLTRFDTLSWLVVCLPLWKMMEFVSWDDDIPNIWKVIIHSCSKPPSSHRMVIDYEWNIGSDPFIQRGWDTPRRFRSLGTSSNYRWRVWTNLLPSEMLKAIRLVQVDEVLFPASRFPYHILGGFEHFPWKKAIQLLGYPIYGNSHAIPMWWIPKGISQSLASGRPKNSMGKPSKSAGSNICFAAHA